MADANKVGPIEIKKEILAPSAGAKAKKQEKEKQESVID